MALLAVPIESCEPRHPGEEPMDKLAATALTEGTSAMMSRVGSRERGDCDVGLMPVVIDFPRLW